MRAQHVMAMVGALCCSCELAAQPSSADRVLQSFSRCRAVEPATARLACFEQATTTLESEVRGKQVTILDREDVTKARKSLFGFTVPRIALFGSNSASPDVPDEPEFTELNTTIVSVRPAANGRVELRLEQDDAVWVTTDPVAFPPKPGAKIRIRKGALGNYFLAIGSDRAVRGMRLR